MDTLFLFTNFKRDKCYIVRDKTEIMLAYYIDNTNTYTIRTQNTASYAYFTMSLQDMYELNNSTMSLSATSFTNYENLFSFTGDISGAYEGAEYRATLYSGETPIWFGSVQVYESQSVDKAVYNTQITDFVSHQTTNEYIIL